MSGSAFTSVSKEIFRLGYEISPIILTGKSQVTQLIPFGMLPIISLTESINFARGILGGAENLELNDFFAHFEPLPGGSLISNRVGDYPFANQRVAANAIISDPLRISLRMICPARGPGGYLTKLATMSALRATLNLHSTTGGTYIVATPAFIYTDCLLTDLRDITQSSGRQVQAEFQWDFTRPLITEEDALEALNAQMTAIASGVPTTGASTGGALTIGQSLASGVAQVQTAVQSLVGGAIQQGGFTAPLLPVQQVPLI